MKKVMGFWRSWGLVVGIMIGSGIFMLPSVLAPYGRFSLVGWVFAGLGTLFIALMFSFHARRNPSVGGLYVYTLDGFGDVTGFLIGWGYWMGIITAIAATSVAFSGYLGFFFPIVSSSPFWGAATSLTVILLTALINLSSIKNASTFQLITTLLKLTPLILVAISGLFWGHLDNVNVPSQQPESDLSQLSTMVLIIMWAFIGVECVTIPADDMINPEKNIPKALIAGTLTVLAVYLAISYATMALLPNSQLATSTSPLADAIVEIFGPISGAIVTIGAMISIVSSVNANVLISGSMPQALSQDNQISTSLCKLNEGGVPYRAINISCVLAAVMVLFNFTEGLISAFKILISLSTLVTILPYVTSSLAILVFKWAPRNKQPKPHLGILLIALVALAFSLFALIGSGITVVIQGSVLLLIGLPFYYHHKYHQKKNQ